MDQSMTEQIASQERSYIKIRKPQKKFIIIAGVVLAIALGAFFARGLFIAAMVNGSPISRLSVVRELEKQSGKQTLKSLIDKKIIEGELDKQGVNVTQADI